MGQTIGTGFCPDVHCANGAPREAFVKITRAEPAGVDGEGRWRPVTLGVTVGEEDERMKKYLAGGFVEMEA